MKTQTTYSDKSLLTILLCFVNLIFNKLFCNSSLPQQVCSANCSAILLFLNRSFLQIVLQFFSSSTGLLCITFFCHSVLLLLCLSFALFLICISFHSVHQLNFILNTFSFLLSYYFILFPYRTTNPIQSRSYSFIQATLTIPLPLPIGNTGTSVLATETLTNLSSSVRFS
jgi:hypothetical protein